MLVFSLYHGDLYSNLWKSDMYFLKNAKCFGERLIGFSLGNVCKRSIKL